MGTMTIIMIALTAVALVFGILYGMGRGRNRSILRLILILGCIAGAIYLRAPVMEFVMNIEVGPDQTLNQMIISAMGTELSEQFQNFALVLVGMILNILVYFILFILLRFVSWLIIFPIFKIFVRTELDKQRGVGAFIGLLQGIVIAFAVLVPLNGLATQVDRISKVEIVMPDKGQGKSGGEGTESEDKKPTVLLEVPQELGLTEYTTSNIASTYASVGNWYFDMLTTVELPQGKLNLTDVCDMLVGMVDVVDSASEASKGIEAIRNGSGTKEETAQTLREIGVNLNKAGDNFNQMNEVAKTLLDGLIESVLEEGQELGFTVSEIKLDHLGDAFISIGDFFEDGIVERKDAENIINGLVDNWGIIEKVYNGGVLIHMEDQNMQNLLAVLGEKDLDPEQSSKIRIMFGL